MRRRQMLAVTAGAAAGMVMGGVPVVASTQDDSAAPLAAAVAGAVEQTVAQYQTLLEQVKSKLPSPAFSELVAFRKRHTFEGCTMAAWVELGLMRLEFVVNGAPAVLSKLQPELAVFGYAGQLADNVLTFGVQALADPAPIHHLMAHVPGNSWAPLPTEEDLI